MKWPSGGCSIFPRIVAADQPADSTLLRMIMEQPLGVLPVVDHGVLVGMITLAGMAAYLVGDEDIESGQWWPSVGSAADHLPLGPVGVLLS